MGQWAQQATTPWNQRHYTSDMPMPWNLRMDIAWIAYGIYRPNRLHYSHHYQSLWKRYYTVSEVTTLQEYHSAPCQCFFYFRLEDNMDIAWSILNDYLNSGSKLLTMVYKDTHNSSIGSHQQPNLQHGHNMDIHLVHPQNWKYEFKIQANMKE